MSYNALPITERVEKIRSEYQQSPVAKETNPYIDRKFYHFCTGDRWLSLGFLEGWLAHENAPTTRRRRAYAEANELYSAKPIITEHELLVGQPYFPEYTPEERVRYEELSKQFHMSNITLIEQGPRIDHLSLNLKKLLEKGLDGLIEEAENYKSELNLNDPGIYPSFDAIKKYDFYECCLIELRAVKDLEMRYVTELRNMAKNAVEPRKSELIEMASILERVPAKPAKTFREALQSAQFFQGTLFGLYPLNRPDRDFFSYYKSDIENGTLTTEFAQELIDNYCLCIVNRIFSRAACGFIVGGQDVNGNLVENDLSFMFLTALEHVRLPVPNGALAVNSMTSEEIINYSIEILSRGITHPAFYNDESIVNSLIKYGVAKEDAVEYIHTTCAEISVVGKTRSHTTCVRVAMPYVLTETVRKNLNIESFDGLCMAYFNDMRTSLQNDMLRYMERMLEASRNANEPIRVCCLVDDCMEKGKSIWEGGERYSFLQPIFVGFSTAVDSLLAIRALVFERKTLTLAQFLDIVDKDFAGEEALRQTIIHKLPHYGNDNVVADKLAQQVANGIKAIFDEHSVIGSDIMMPGTFSYVDHAGLGSRDGASFDGRHAHVSYSDGCSPSQGRDTNGPTAMILSLTSWDQSAYLAGMVVNIKFTPKHLMGENATVFKTILKTFINRGGLEIQVNSVTRETLEDAKAHPEDHEDLIVRIGGFSDYFVRLSDALQNEIIERTEY